MQTTKVFINYIKKNLEFFKNLKIIAAKLSAFLKCHLKQLIHQATAIRAD